MNFWDVLTRSEHLASSRTTISSLTECSHAHIQGLVPDSQAQIQEPIGLEPFLMLGHKCTCAGYIEWAHTAPGNLWLHMKPAAVMKTPPHSVAMQVSSMAKTRGANLPWTLGWLTWLHQGVWPTLMHVWHEIIVTVGKVEGNHSKENKIGRKKCVGLTSGF